MALLPRLASWCWRERSCQTRGHAGKKLPDHLNSIAAGLHNQRPWADISFIGVKGFIKECFPSGMCRKRDMRCVREKNLRWIKNQPSKQVESGSTDRPDRLVSMCVVKPADELPEMAERILSLRISGWILRLRSPCELNEAYTSSRLCCQAQ